jgi:ubiquinone/menaquinone biosynthesis C-methylase UbiE
MNIQVAYNNWSDTYDDDHNLTRDLDQKVTEKILADSRYKIVIELGCGTGKNTLLLSKIAEKVYATDFSSGMVEKVKQER